MLRRLIMPILRVVVFVVVAFMVAITGFCGVQHNINLNPVNTSKFVVLELSCFPYGKANMVLGFDDEARRFLPSGAEVLKLAYISYKVQHNGKSQDNAMKAKELETYLNRFKQKGYSLCVLDGFNFVDLDQGVNFKILQLSPGTPIDRLWFVINVKGFKIGVVGLTKKLSDFPDTYNNFLAHMNGIDWLIVFLGEKIPSGSGPVLFNTHKEMDLICAPGVSEQIKFGETSKRQSSSNESTDMIKSGNRLLIDVKSDLPKIILFSLALKKSNWQIVDIKELTLR